MADAHAGHTYLAPCAGAWRNGPAQALARLNDFKRLTSVVARNAESSSVRVVLSAGGAAGGVVSEGQGYGLLIASAVASALSPDHPQFGHAIQVGYELFLGWQRMCEHTTVNPGNQCVQRSNATQCGAKMSECFPSWKFDDRVVTELGTGSAPDGDEDALLGLVLLTLATQDARPTWWESVARWAYSSCRAFIAIQSAAHPLRKAANGQPLRALKLGSCWGGWDCSNPSYHAPAHYRVFRNFLWAYSSAFGADPDEGRILWEQWDSLIEASYTILDEAHCHANGLTTNWWVPAGATDFGFDAERKASQWPAWQPGTPTCSGSGTRGNEFGAEASRSAWRIALDALWFDEPRAVQMSQDVAASAVVALLHDSELQPGCAVAAVQAHWQNEAYMLGPIATAMMVPLPQRHLLSRTHQQQLAVERAGKRLAALSIRGREDYYPGAWTIISSLTLNGVLPNLAELVKGLGTRSSPTEYREDDVTPGGWTGSRCPVLTPDAPRASLPPSTHAPSAHIASLQGKAARGNGATISEPVAVVLGMAAVLVFVAVRRRMHNRWRGQHSKVPTHDLASPKRNGGGGSTALITQRETAAATVHCDQPSSLLHQPVTIFGLVEAQELNDCRGTAVSFDGERCSIDVLDAAGGVVDRVAVRPCNVRRIYSTPSTPSTPVVSS